MKKKLTKSNNNIVITGALGGIGEYFGIDPTVVRIIYIVLTFFLPFAPIVLYIVLAFLIPSDKSYNGRNRNSYGGTYRNPMYGPSHRSTKPTRKQAEKVDSEEDWSDF